MNKPTGLWWGILVAAIAGVFAASGWAWLVSSNPVSNPAQPSPLRFNGPRVPAFDLIDQTGAPFGSASLRGRVWIADFIFTSCAGSCPQITERMRSLQKRLPAQIQFVSISVDPGRDSPTALADYAKRAGADPSRWRFLTGPEASIRKLVQQGFRLSYLEGTDPQEPVIHSIRLVLVDQEGNIRGYYDSTESSAVEQLIQDAKELLAQHSTR